MENLTKKQTETLNFIKKYFVSHGFPPSVREICKGMDLRSPATAQSHLNELARKGFIRKESGKFRTIELLVDNEFENKKDDIIKVPLLGKISCGNPIEAIENPNEYFDLPASIVPNKDTIFTLKCSGDSMINAGIYDGDYVIVKKQKVAKNNDIVVAYTPDNEVTLKRFFKEKDHIRLQPENDFMEPIILNNCEILGIAIGLYRKIS